ncbi:MAG: alpha-1,4-glucan--maltose-1-phosphate maltosyltransferase [Sedimentisphaerales bacterium]|nr:alpha-1,4-glucan--maltose-1-phosphate maltosyltransferase [Sedimentisphaerales bacterium]
MSKDIDGRRRVVIEGVKPQINGGQFAIKRAVGESVVVKANVFGDGHDLVRAEVLYRRRSEDDWTVREMQHVVNDEWTARFEVDSVGEYVYTVRAWIDHFATWQSDLGKRHEAGQDVRVPLKIGAEMLRDAARCAEPADAAKLNAWAETLEAAQDVEVAVELARSKELTDVAGEYPDRSLATMYEPELRIRVDRPRAVFSAWYEFFPRSFGADGRHGTFRDCERMLAEIAGMGFDVVYLPPIHPIGQVNRKGKNNATVCTPTDPGSPWAIGSAEGGHKAIDPLLGSMDDFQRFVEKAKGHGLEVAMDVAFQCAPDHPYIQAHPEWFRWRPDGTVQFAENPPKKYEDILPLNFESKQWQALWEELHSVVQFWIDQGIRMFRVDNPHTKPLAFWQWLIEGIRKDHPDVLFLAEAFTRPKVMQYLAKAGFNQSYTYFTWRNSKWELEQYIRDLTQTEVGEYLRPNFWPNTPDILPQYLQCGGRAAFIVRLVLAATLSASYGIYGPAFELCVSEAIEGREEYFNSEKYEIKQWDWNQPGNIRAVIERVNRIRRQNPALQTIRNIQLYGIDNESLLCYGKSTEDQSNVIVTVVNLDPHHRQSGWIQLPLDAFQIDPRQTYLMDDLLTGDKFIWQGQSNYVELDPRVMPAHILCMRKRLRRETDFDYFM